MGVRLNKVLTELNIGLQTAVDYLKNKPNLGEIKDDANMNTKINDEQYEALVKAFKGNKSVMPPSGMFFPKKKPKAIRCTRLDINGKECGYMNAYDNNYCVKCGRLLEGKKKVEIVEVDKIRALDQNRNSLAEKVEKLLKENRNYERHIQETKHWYDKMIRNLTEKNKELMDLIGAQEEEIQQIKEGKGFSSIFAGNPSYELFLKDAGPAKLQVVKVVKESLDLGLKEAKDIVDSAPTLLKRGLPKSEAERLKKAIEAAGAVVEIR